MIVAGPDGLQVLRELLEAGELAHASAGPTRWARSPRPCGRSRQATPAARASSPSEDRRQRRTALAFALLVIILLRGARPSSWTVRLDRLSHLARATRSWRSGYPTGSMSPCRGLRTLVHLVDEGHGGRAGQRRSAPEPACSTGTRACGRVGHSATTASRCVVRHPVPQGVAAAGVRLHPLGADLKCQPTPAEPSARRLPVRLRREARRGDGAVPAERARPAACRRCHHRAPKDPTRRSQPRGRQHHGRCLSWSATSRKVASQAWLPMPQSRPNRTMTASASGAT